jgi:hypothetical protein
MWLCATKANYDCAANRMLEGGFVIPRQIMFVPRWYIRLWSCNTKANHVSAGGRMLEVALGYKDKSCRWCKLNVRRWFCGQG